MIIGDKDMEQEFKFTSRSEEDTLELAQNIESEKFPGMIICLNGELGSGKTMFVKGFAQALGIEETITSPTFNIVKEYLSGELPLYHMDVYRIEETDNSIGYTDYFNNEGICIIEWSELIQSKLPEERLEVKIVIIDENTRVFKFTPYGRQYEDLCSAVL